MSEQPGLEVVVHKLQDPGLHRNTDAEGLQVAQPGKILAAELDPRGTEKCLVDTTPKDRTIWGRRTKVLLGCLILALVIAGAVAGGVAGSQAHKHKQRLSTSSSQSTSPTTSSSNTNSDTNTQTTSSTHTTTTHTTATTTSSAPVTSGTSGIAENPCPAKNQTTYTSSTGSLFSLFCAVDWPSGDAAADGNGTVSDLYSTTEYTLDSCIEACITYNKDATSGTCHGVVYNSNLTAAFDGGQDANCFLKDRIGKYYPNGADGMAAGQIG